MVMRASFGFGGLENKKLRDKRMKDRNLPLRLRTLKWNPFFVNNEFGEAISCSAGVSRRAEK
jgi:hypothetical protein